MKKSTTKPTRVATVLKVLTFSLACIYWQQASHACSVHDHGCIYHARTDTVYTSPQPNANGTSLVIYAIGTKNNAPSAVDFDNKVLLPGMTGDRVLVNSYTDPTDPYIINATTYGSANPPPDWNPGGNDGARQVYPSQYQIIFNGNTATARHTGEFNGGENGNIPNATGCPNMPSGAINCESVVVAGNVPNGFYEQRVRLFNFPNVPNPEVDIQLGAYTTGTGRLISATHIPASGSGREVADFISLAGTGTMSNTYKYEFYDPGFIPHAAGVAWFDRSRSHMRYNTTEDGNLRISTTHRITDTTRTTIQGDGWADQQHWRNTKLVGRTVEEIARSHFDQPHFDIAPTGTVLVTMPGSLSINVRNTFFDQSEGEYEQNPKYDLLYFTKKAWASNMESYEKYAAGEIGLARRSFDILYTVPDVAGNFIYDNAATIASAFPTIFANQDYVEIRSSYNSDGMKLATDIATLKLNAAIGAVGAYRTMDEIPSIAKFSRSVVDQNYQQAKIILKELGIGAPQGLNKMREKLHRLNNQYSGVKTATSDFISTLGDYMNIEDDLEEPTQK